MKKMWVERQRERQVLEKIPSVLKERRQDGGRRIKKADEIRNIKYGEPGRATVTSRGKL